MIKGKLHNTCLKMTPLLEKCFCHILLICVIDREGKNLKIRLKLTLHIQQLRNHKIIKCSVRYFHITSLLLNQYKATAKANIFAIHLLMIKFERKECFHI